MMRIGETQRVANPNKMTSSPNLSMRWPLQSFCSSRLLRLSSKLSPSFTCYDIDELFEDNLHDVLSDSAEASPLTHPKTYGGDSDDEMGQEESVILGPGLR